MSASQGDKQSLDPSEKHFVWVVHGTFNGPEEHESPKWYQFDPDKKTFASI